jgi:hypothetical protein
MSSELSDLTSSPAPQLPPAYPTPPRPPKSAGLALVLSLLFPGLGQVYNGQPAKALVFFFAFVGSIYGVVEINPLPFAFGIPFAFFWSLVDAYRSAELINARAAGGLRTEDDMSESPAWGASLMALGLVLLLHTLGWLNFAVLQRYWPILLIVAGAGLLMSSLRKRGGFGA